MSRIEASRSRGRLLAKPSFEDSTAQEFPQFSIHQKLRDLRKSSTKYDILKSENAKITKVNGPATLKIDVKTTFSVRIKDHNPAAALIGFITYKRS